MEEKLIIKKGDKEVEYDILFTFECQENEKCYIGCTDHAKNEIGEEAILLFSYDPIIGKETLSEVKTQEELDMVENVLDQIRKGGERNGRS